MEEEWILEDSSSLWSADAGRLEYDDSFPCPWSTGVEEEWLEYDDSFPCPWSTGVEEEWILEDSSSLRSADAGRLEEYDDNSCPCSTVVEEELDAMIGPC